MNELYFILPVFIFFILVIINVRKEKSIANKCLRFINTKQQYFCAKPKDNRCSGFMKAGSPIHQNHIIIAARRNPIDHLSNLVS